MSSCNLSEVIELHNAPIAVLCTPLALIAFIAGLVFAPPFATAHHFNNGPGYPSNPHKGCSPLDDYINYPRGVSFDDFSFEEACNQHDHCYQHGYQWGVTQDECDQQFYVQMSHSCDEEFDLTFMPVIVAPGIPIFLVKGKVKHDACEALALLYFEGVQDFGRGSFHANPWVDPDGKTLWCSPRVAPGDWEEGVIPDPHCTPSLYLKTEKRLDKVWLPILLQGSLLTIIDKNEAERRRWDDPFRGDDNIGVLLLNESGDDTTLLVKLKNRPEHAFRLYVNYNPDEVRVIPHQFTVYPNNWTEEISLQVRGVDDRQRFGNRSGSFDIMYDQCIGHDCSSCSAPNSCLRYRYMNPVSVWFLIEDTGQEIAELPEASEQKCTDGELFYEHPGGAWPSLRRTKTHEFEMGTSSGQFDFVYDAFGHILSFEVTYEDQALFKSGCPHPLDPPLRGRRSLSYEGMSSTIDVTVESNCHPNAFATDYWWYEIELDCD